MFASAIGLMLAIVQGLCMSGAPAWYAQGPEKLCMYQPGVPKAVANPGPGATPILVTAQGEANNEPGARSAAQLNWSRKVQASYGPAFAMFGKSRLVVFTCREGGNYLSPARTCSVQAQPCN